MYKLGLKLWSTNTDAYYNKAMRLYDQGIYDYIELFVVPDTLDTLYKWKGVKNIPFIIHNAHSAIGFNLADASASQRNKEIYSQTKQFADELDSKYIIFHGGVDGNIKEVVKQLASFNDSRTLLENKPYLPLPNKMQGKVCRGATIDEVKYVLDEVGCGFCFDIGHAVCSANYQMIEPYAYLKRLNELQPKMYHFSDVIDMQGVYDAHPHLGKGQLDIKRLKQEIFSDGVMITIETVKDSKEDLNDFVKDILWLKKII